MVTTTSGEYFLAFMRQEVCSPRLKDGDVGVMDNRAARKMIALREAVEAAGVTARLQPPYSPELNPVEKLWNKLNEMVRREATDTRKAFDEAVANARDAISTSELAAGTATVASIALQTEIGPGCGVT